GKSPTRSWLLSLRMSERSNHYQRNMTDDPGMNDGISPIRARRGSRGVVFRPLSAFCRQVLRRRQVTANVHHFILVIRNLTGIARQTLNPFENGA
ncbi:MAG: hypothetical protein KDA71_24805, partial [Planctomycetales bacterium]|nr:hypothetical protein [Planctomycetales bacterium]